MAHVLVERDAACNELLDARAKCVYHSAGWWLLDNAVFHLVELWLSEARGKKTHVVYLNCRGALIRD